MMVRAGFAICVLAVSFTLWVNGTVDGVKIIEIMNSYENGTGGGSSTTSVSFTDKLGVTKEVGVRVSCGKQNIALHLNTTGNFTGMLYPIDSDMYCIRKFINVDGSNVTFHLPLKACNTKMEVKEDGIEYTNVLIMEAHTNLVGPGAKFIGARCKYPNLVQTLNTNFTIKNNKTLTKQLFNISSGPRLFMDIYSGDITSKTLATKVHVGQKLTMVIGMENYEMYSLRVFNCSVYSGRGNNQYLYDMTGCAYNKAIMGELTYSKSNKFAFVTYDAHKFPATSTVFYKCGVKFCVNTNDVCGASPPKCPGGPPSSLLKTEEFYKLYGNRSFSQTSIFGHSTVTGPQLPDGTQGPILGGLTPEMIEKIFYGEGGVASVSTGALRLARSVVWQNADSGSDDTRDLITGLQVVDPPLKLETQTVPTVMPAPTTPEPFSKPCWERMKLPFIVSVVLLVSAMAGSIYLCVWLNRRKPKPTLPRLTIQPSPMAETYEMRDLSTISMTPPPSESLDAGSFASIDYRREFPPSSIEFPPSPSEFETSYIRRAITDQFRRAPIRTRGLRPLRPYSRYYGQPRNVHQRPVCDERLWQ